MHIIYTIKTNTVVALHIIFTIKTNNAHYQYYQH